MLSPHNVTIQHQGANQLALLKRCMFLNGPDTRSLKLYIQNQ